jgi:hypothetical protein
MSITKEVWGEELPRFFVRFSLSFREEFVTQRRDMSSRFVDVRDVLKNQIVLNCCGSLEAF